MFGLMEARLNANRLQDGGRQRQRVGQPIGIGRYPRFNTIDSLGRGRLICFQVLSNKAQLTN